MKEVIRGRTPDTMDTLVQQTESPFIPEVLNYPLPAKFMMPQVVFFLEDFELRAAIISIQNLVPRLV